MVFLALLVFELFTMYATDRRTDGRTKATLNAPYPTGGGIITANTTAVKSNRPIGMQLFDWSTTARTVAVMAAACKHNAEINKKLSYC